MEYRNVNELKPHPKSIEIYLDKPNEYLVNSVKRDGIWESRPLVITDDNLVVGGCSRLQIAKDNNIIVIPVVVKKFNNEIELLRFILEDNANRDKTTEQLINEGLIWKKIKEAEAEQRRLATLKQNSTDKENLPYRTNEEKGQSRDLAAAEIGWSGKKLDMGATVKQDVIDRLEKEGELDEAERIRDILNNQSVNAAYKEVKQSGYLIQIPETEINVKQYYVLSDWNNISSSEKEQSYKTVGISKFNGTGKSTGERRFEDEETGENNADDVENKIDWAPFSWNPISGCNHGCKYCYARDIANRFYAQKFEPTFWPYRLSAPRNTNPKSGKWGNNVFCVSMGDMFGEWVPQEWIDAVMKSITDNPQWNFIILTKNPQRLTENVFPKNVWLGTTVDSQNKVKIAQDTFKEVSATVKFLSCEPFVDYIEFDDMSMFDWIIVGGRSKNTALPAARPTGETLDKFRQQVKSFGCKIYEKSNLLIKEYPA